MKYLVTILLTISALHQPIYAQGGPLTPPGPPGPTMTTLSALSSQVTATDTKVTALQSTVTGIDAAVSLLNHDRRTVITAAPYTIYASGSYVLGGNLTVTSGTAINIFADNVSLDLNGFTISSTASPVSGRGVLIGNNRRAITVRNGFIQGATTRSDTVFTTGGFDSGIENSFSPSRDIHVIDVHVSGVGVGGGILLNSNTAPGNLVERCTVGISAGFGIIAHTVRASSAVECGNTAISATTVVDSEGITVSTGSSHGIDGREVINSNGVAVGGSGILGSSIMNSRGTSTTGSGINCSGTASYCRGSRNGGGVAINAQIAIGCTVSGSGTVSAPEKHLGTP